MNIKTSELTGAALDWAVAKCVGHIDSGRVVIYPYRTYDDYSSPLGFSPPVDVYYCNDYRPSTDWSQGGPIIERERMTVGHDATHSAGKMWFAEMPLQHGRVRFMALADAPLIAAMRCFVTSKLGDEVDIPEELQC